MKINVLGTDYELFYRAPHEDDILSKGECNGYCDPSTKRIVVTTENTDLGSFETEQKKIVRHELIHAFLFESGLGASWEHNEYGHEETVVDWMAFQFPKLLEAFKIADVM